jgi:TolA-binding protein
MKPWIALAFGLCLGQTPEAPPAVPPAEVRDPAALALRDAWERALQNADATDEGQDTTDGSVRMPALEVGTPAGSLRTVSAETATPQATGPGTSGTGGAGTAGATQGTDTSQATSPAAPSQRATGPTRQDMANLNSQVQSLQTQLEENTAHTTQLQQQLAGMQERAQELERMRQQRVSELARARASLLAADRALEVGDLSVGDMLDAADAALEAALSSAATTGNRDTVLLVLDARAYIAQVLDSAGHRDIYQARSFLFGADWRLREAMQRNLDTSDATLVNQ